MGGRSAGGGVWLEIYDEAAVVGPDKAQQARAVQRTGPCKKTWSIRSIRGEPG